MIWWSILTTKWQRSTKNIERSFEMHDLACYLLAPVLPINGWPVTFTYCSAIPISYCHCSLNIDIVHIQKYANLKLVQYCFKGLWLPSCALYWYTTSRVHLTDVPLRSIVTVNHVFHWHLKQRRQHLDSAWILRLDWLPLANFRVSARLVVVYHAVWLGPPN